jgi:hypothetical protein
MSRRRVVLIIRFAMLIRSLLTIALVSTTVHAQRKPVAKLDPGLLRLKTDSLEVYVVRQGKQGRSGTIVDALDTVRVNGELRLRRVYSRTEPAAGRRRRYPGRCFWRHNAQASGLSLRRRWRRAPRVAERTPYGPDRAERPAGTTDRHRRGGRRIQQRELRSHPARRAAGQRLHTDPPSF